MQLGLGRLQLGLQRFLPRAPLLAGPPTPQTQSLPANCPTPAFPSLPQGKQLVCVSTGDYHNAAICHDGRLWVWGRGDCGQLGLGDDKNRWAPKPLAGFSIIHPDRTLRRNRKPVLKALLLQEDAAGGSGSGRSSGRR